MGAAILAAIALVLNTASPGTYRCTFDQRETCSPDTGCEAVAPSTWVEVNLEAQTYARCDAKGCDPYDAVVTRSGIWRIVEVPGHATFAKIADDGLIVDVASLNRTVLVSYGKCEAQS